MLISFSFFTKCRHKKFLGSSRLLKSLGCLFHKLNIGSLIRPVEFINKNEKTERFISIHTGNAILYKFIKKSLTNISILKHKTLSNILRQSFHIRNILTILARAGIIPAMCNFMGKNVYCTIIITLYDSKSGLDFYYDIYISRARICQTATNAVYGRICNVRIDNSDRANRFITEKLGIPIK